MFFRNDNKMTVLVASLGYFIDMFDFFIFNLVRVPSLTDLGLAGDALTQSGLLISNCSLAGIILGAWASGIMGDRMGRKASLFISILLYSAGTLATAYVQSVEIYAIARFIACLGLAGELGQGITLIAEKFSPTKRGAAIGIFIIMGFVGALTAALVSEMFDWRTVYLMGGGTGFLLLLTRMWLSESAMYHDMAAKHKKRGGLWLILKHPKQCLQWCAATCLIVPAVFMPQIVYTLSPEIARAMQIDGTVKANLALAIGFCGVIIGDTIAVVISEIWQSRKKTVLLFLGIGVTIFTAFLTLPIHTVTEYYIMCGCLGLTFGIWIISAIWITEHFSTHVRATATSTALNFGRGFTIPMNLAYGALLFMGAEHAVMIIGICVFMLSLIGWFGLRETYGHTLDKHHG